MEPPASASRDCTPQCRSRQHAALINAALTKKTASDAQLRRFVQSVCWNFASGVDAEGRSALHVAAACGRTSIVSWLVQKGALLEARDAESGYTALHLSILHGWVETTVTLLQLGASLGVADRDHLTPADHLARLWAEQSAATLPSPAPPPSVRLEAYVWGTDGTHLLGAGGWQRQLAQPELLGRSGRLAVSHVAAGKFHSLLVASGEGRVYASGHGQGGRLGLGGEGAELQHRRLAQPPDVLLASAGRDHSLLLDQRGHVWSCGLNDHFVLGLSPAPSKALVPARVPGLRSVVGVAAGRFHSVAWSRSNVYTWGRHAGQLGHAHRADAVVQQPTGVAQLKQAEPRFIAAAAASDGATVVAMSTGQLLALAEFQCRLLQPSIRGLVVKLCAVGGHLEPRLCPGAGLTSDRVRTELRLLALTAGGEVYLWRESQPQVALCHWLGPVSGRPLHHLRAVDVCLHRRGLLLATVDGRCFAAEAEPAAAPRPLATLAVTATTGRGGRRSAPKMVQKVRLATGGRSLRHLHRCWALACDPAGDNFLALQLDPHRHSADAEPSVRRSDMTDCLSRLLAEGDEVSDVVFEVDGHKFYAHKYIIASSSPKLYSEIKSVKSLAITDMGHEAFSQLLNLIYTGSTGRRPSRPPPADVNPAEISAYEFYQRTRTPRGGRGRNVEQELKRAAERYRIPVKEGLDDGVAKRFDRAAFPELQDVTVLAEGGAEMRAHKCILAARLEYFACLFSFRWNVGCGRSTVSLDAPAACVAAFLDYLYTDACGAAASADGVDLATALLHLAEQLLADRLKELCEAALAERLCLRTVGPALAHAAAYNALQLAAACCDFIGRNLPAVLESGCLAALDADGQLLRQVTAHFRRRWAPLLLGGVAEHAAAPTDAALARAARLFRSNATAMLVEEEVASTRPKQHRRRRRSRSSGGRNGSGERGVAQQQQQQPEQQKEQQKEQQRRREVEHEQEEEKKGGSWTKIAKTKPRPPRPVPSLEDRPPSPEAFVRLTALPLTPPHPSQDSFQPASPSQQSFLHEYLAAAESSGAPTITCSSSSRRLSQKQRKRLAVVAAGPASSPGEASGAEPLQAVAASPPTASPWRPLTPPPEQSLAAADEGLPLEQIVASERRMRRRVVRLRTKSFRCAEMEDRAIEELQRFYNVDCFFEEIITVERVDDAQLLDIAPPQWVPCSISSSSSSSRR